MDNAALTKRILKTCKDKNIQMSKGALENLYLNSTCNSFEKIIAFIEKNRDEKLDFIIIDYLQLCKKTKNYQILFDCTKSMNLNVLITSQLSKKAVVESEIFTELVVGIREKDDGLLNFIDEVNFLTNTHGVIKFDNVNRDL